MPDEYMTKLLKNAGDLKGVELKKHLKATILEEFRVLKSKPRWLQSPAWVFIDGKPLLFVGQLDITEIWHDTARLYVFYDEATEKYHTVEQFM